MPLLKLSALVIEKRLCPKGALWPPGRWDGPGDLPLPILLALLFPPNSVSPTSGAFVLIFPRLTSSLDSVFTSPSKWASASLAHLGVLSLCLFFFLFLLLFVRQGITGPRLASNSACSQGRS